MSKSPPSLIHYLELAQKFKEENLTIPSKTESIQSIKHALNHCTKDQLYLVADMMDLPHKTSESRMKLNRRKRQLPNLVVRMSQLHTTGLFSG